MSGFTELMAAVAAEAGGRGTMTPSRLPRSALDWLIAGAEAPTPSALIDVGLGDAEGTTAFGAALRRALLDERHPLFAVRSRRAGALRELELLTVDGIGCLIEDDGGEEIAFGIASPGELGMLAARWLELRPVPELGTVRFEQFDARQFAAAVAAGGEVITVALRGAPMLDLLMSDDGSLRELTPGDGFVTLRPVGSLEVLLALERILGAEWSAPDPEPA